jgi:hypothetical protein
MNKSAKFLFYAGITGISLFELMSIYLIMPMPGSQEMKSIDIAYFLYRQRWIFRIVFLAMIVFGIGNAFRIKKKWIPAVCLLTSGIIIYFFNFQMKADKMFRQPEHPIFKTMAQNKVNINSIVIGVENNGMVKAYPVQFMAYHHQVQDTIGGKPLIITYCNVCRTGRVYEPIVNGHHETFRLVGMDHFNAMFEDATTGSWWRQATGEAVSGPLKGHLLPEAESMQVSVKKLFELYPEAQVMQADKSSKLNYDSLRKFEQGLSKGKLTRTDSLSWKGKSWVIGITEGSQSKAYDWNKLKTEHVINDKIGPKPIVIALSEDSSSFVAFERPNENDTFKIKNDTLFSGEQRYDFNGRSSDPDRQRLKKINAYQEFWHSWKTFHPASSHFE